MAESKNPMKLIKAIQKSLPEDHPISKSLSVIQAYISDLEQELAERTAPDPIVDENILLLVKRSKDGKAKYGTTLEENNKDNFLQHLQEELLDAANYVQKLKQK